MNSDHKYYMQCLTGFSLPMLAVLSAVDNRFEKYNYMQYTMIVYWPP